MKNIQSLPVKRISTSGGTQSRADIIADVVEEYRQVLDDLPPLIVFFDGKAYWLADGFHRLAAAVLDGKAHILCEVVVGSRRDAVLYSVGANTMHGLRRTNADKRRAVETLLSDAEWVLWSDREIARRCGASNPFVGSVRRDMSDNVSQTTRKFVRGGAELEMIVAKSYATPEEEIEAIHAEEEDLADELIDEGEMEYDQAAEVALQIKGLGKYIIRAERIIKNVKYLRALEAARRKLSEINLLSSDA